jgi:hypothetical protein
VRLRELARFDNSIGDARYPRSEWRAAISAEATALALITKVRKPIQSSLLVALTSVHYEFMT